MKAIIVIPSRFESSRFPGKPLAEICGKTMIQRVWELASKNINSAEVLIATDDERIESVVSAFGAKVVMTSPHCKNGTERVADALSKISESYDLVINLQGDSPLTQPRFIDSLITLMIQNPQAEMGTLAIKLSEAEARELFLKKKNGSTSGTLVVFDKDHNASYFSNSFIPFPRGEDFSSGNFYRHLGIYAFRQTALDKYISLKETRLEKVEKLEQLRALENGMGIKIAEVESGGRTYCSVDTPHDLKLVESIIEKEGEL